MDRNSRIKDVWNNPIGHDVIKRLLLQTGKSEGIITNPIVGNLKIKTVEKFVKKKVGSGFFDSILTLLNNESDTPGDGSGPITHAWWKEAVFYQIYPRSFADSNGDGIGDLRGIIGKLDYLKDLGVDVLWLSPIYDSPMDDNGYDIRNYRAINKDFGTMEDFDELLSETHKRGMRLIMDLVVNHSSDEHEWFQTALKDKNSKYRNYYFFRDGGDKEPNNWTSFFSGTAWNHYEKEDTWALHLFSKKQMDLNWDNPELRADVIDMIRWWLEKGVDGFRMDVINYISKAPGLPDGDPFIGKLMGFTGVETYFYGPNLHKRLKEIREKAFEPYNAFSVGETPGLGMQMCRLVTGEERKELDMVFSFDHLETPGHTRFEDYRYDLNYYKDYQIDWALHYGNNCQMSLFLNNHDNPRMISKVDPNPKHRDALAKLLAAMQLTLPGTPFLYQGDEMGLVNYEFKNIDEIDDLESRNLYPELCEKMGPEEAFKVILAGTREHARILLPWNKNTPKMQIPDVDVHKFYKEFLAFRKGAGEIHYGDFTVLRDERDIFTYKRDYEGKSLIVDCNLGTSEKEAFSLPEGYKTVFESETEGSKFKAYGFKVSVK